VRRAVDGEQRLLHGLLEQGLRVGLGERRRGRGWRWDWVRQVRELGFALDADAAGQQQWRQLARQAALRGKSVVGLPPEAYGEHKDANEAWAAGVLAVGGGSRAGDGSARRALREDFREAWNERVAIMVAAGGVPRAEAERWAWAGLQEPCSALSVSL